ncbi:MAG: hypothetical protein GY754_42630 [bacterium]|nr:hypothetical protein [bacterium]
MLRKLLSSFLSSFLLLILISLVISTTACSTDSEGDSTTGSLTIDLSTATMGKTIVPDFDMTPHSYIITGAGPGNFSVSTQSGSARINGLTPGNWTITVEALNAGSNPIGQGTSAITITAGQASICRVTVTPLSGNGTMSLTVLWNADIIPGDASGISIETTLALNGGTAIAVAPEDITVNETERTASIVCERAAGYYTVQVTLKADDTPVGNAADVIRVLKDPDGSSHTYTETLAIMPVPGSGGTPVVIDPDLKDEIGISFSGQESILSLGQTMSITAAAPAETGTIAYTWYLNGSAIATGDSCSFGSDLPEGTYQVVVTAFLPGEERAGSLSHSFEVTADFFEIPLIPENLHADIISYDSILLAWDDTSECESGFSLERSLDGISYTEIASLTQNTSSFLDTGLDPVTVYYYRVRAFNNSGSSAYSTEYSGETTYPAPLAPENLITTNSTSGTIDLAWNDLSSFEDGFSIERSNDGSAFTEITTVTANSTTYADSGLTPDTTWFYRVRAYNDIGNSAYSNIADTTTPDVAPADPAGLTALAVSASEITISWTDNSGNESGFRVERSPDGSAFTEITTVAANATSYADSGLTPDTAWFYRVRAYNDIGNSAYSNTANAATPDVVPADPAGLTASAVSASEITISWNDNSGNESGFRIERSPDGSAFTEITTVAANVTSYADTGLTPDSAYFYRVRAYNDIGNSAYSNTANAATPDVAPDAPAGLTALAVSASAITISWTDNSNNESGFRVERSLDGSSFSEITTTAANVSTYADTGLTPDTAYFYRVRAYNDIDNSAYSNTANAATPDVVPADPAGLTALAVSASEITISWTDNAGNESGFSVERSPDGSAFTEVTTVAANVTSYADSGLTPHTAYFYRVRAYNAIGNSAYSNTANTTTPDVVPADPAGLTAAAVSASEITISWTDNSGNESGFRVERSPDGSAFTEITTVSADVATYTDSGLSSASTYYYRVRAYNGIGSSGYSAAASASTDNPDELAAYWKLDDSALDETSNNNGTEVSLGTFSYIDGIVGRAASFNSTYDDHILCPANSSLNSTTQSISFWGRSRDANSGICLARGINNEDGWRISWGSGNINITYNNIGQQGYAGLTPWEGIPLDQWYHITIVIDESIGSYGQIRSYVNGVHQEGFDHPMQFSLLTTDTRKLYIGKKSEWGAAWNGDLDEVRIYNRALSDDEITALYQGNPGATPAPPSYLETTPVTSTQIDLTWIDNALNEEGFHLERSEDDGSTYAIIAQPAADSTSYSDTGLSPGTLYRYRVRAYNADGNSSYSTSESTTTPDVAPDAPASLLAASVSAAEISLSWIDSANNETGFRIERSPDGSSFTEIGTVSANTTSYADSGVSPDSSYYYRVRAYNAAGDSSYSNTANATTPDVAPDAPDSLLAASVSSTEISLSWNDSADNETGFKIERSPDGSSFTEIGTAAANTTSYADNGVSPNSSYYYRVRAYNAVGDSSYSNTANATTPEVAPDAPDSLLATSVSAAEISLSWIDSANNETGFRIERSPDGSSFTEIGTVSANTTSCASTGLLSNTTYYYRVAAFNTAGDSDYSNISNAATASESATQIIADHTIVDDYDIIPQHYIDEVKKMLLNLPGESHARGYIYGMELLESADSRFAVNAVWDTVPEAYTADHLRVLKAMHSSGWDYMVGEEDTWTSQSAVDQVNAHLEYCRINQSNNVDVFGWGWCWDMTATNGPGGTMDPVYKVRWAGRSYTGSGDQGRWGLDNDDTALTGNSINMNNYLDAIESFIANNPDTTVFFTTGPVDGWTNSGENGYQRWLKHQYIRNYVLANSSRILFDYADILTHSPGGTMTQLSWTDSESSPHSFAGIYSGYEGEYDSGRGTCHVSGEGVTRLGKAMWWMLARIAGWDGLPE